MIRKKTLRKTMSRDDLNKMKSSLPSLIKSQSQSAKSSLIGSVSILKLDIDKIENEKYYCPIKQALSKLIAEKDVRSKKMSQKSSNKSSFV